MRACVVEAFVLPELFNFAAYANRHAQHSTVSTECILVGGAENARLKNAELENPAPNHRGGKRGTGKRGNLKVIWKAVAVENVQHS